MQNPTNHSMQPSKKNMFHHGPVKVDDFPTLNGIQRAKSGARYSEATAHSLSTSTAHHTTQFAKFLLSVFGVWGVKKIGENKVRV